MLSIERHMAASRLVLKKTVVHAVAKPRHQFSVGYSFGEWRVAGTTIVKRKPIKGGRLVGYPYTPVQCACGNPETYEVRTTNLRSGRSRSCGCWSQKNG